MTTSKTRIHHRTDRYADLPLTDLYIAPPYEPNITATLMEIMFSLTDKQRYVLKNLVNHTDPDTFEVALLTALES